MFQAKQQRKENKLFTSSFMQSCDDALRTVHMCTHTQLAWHDEANVFFRMSSNNKNI